MFALTISQQFTQNNRQSALCLSAKQSLQVALQVKKHDSIFSTLLPFIGVGTIFFQLGEQKLVKNNQSRQSNSKYNFMQYVFSVKGIHSAQWSLWQSPRSLGIFENFCVKSNLTVCEVTFNCKLQKKLGEQKVLVAPLIILLGKQLPPLLPHLRFLWKYRN